MKSPEKFYYLNLTTNILVVVTVASLVGLLAYRAVFLSSLNSTEAEMLRAGSNFKGLQEVDFETRPHTILLAMDIHCRYSAQVLPFYKKIIAKSTEKSSVRVIAIFNNKEEEINRYLREHEIDTEFIPNVDLVKLGVDATPTVIWVNANRKILGSYQGLLPENLETAFFTVYEKRIFGK